MRVERLSGSVAAGASSAETFLRGGIFLLVRKLKLGKNASAGVVGGSKSDERSFHERLPLIKSRWLDDD